MVSFPGVLTPTECFAALAAGASHALAVDGSAAALSLAQGGARAMGAEARLILAHSDADRLVAFGADVEQLLRETVARAALE